MRKKGVCSSQTSKEYLWICETQREEEEKEEEEEEEIDKRVTQKERHKE